MGLVAKIRSIQVIGNNELIGCHRNTYSLLLRQEAFSNCIPVDQPSMVKEVKRDFS
jgi:hypothetical protein